MTSLRLILLSCLYFLAVQAVTDDPPARFVTKQFKTISGKRMAYVEVGEGDPIVFLHGNPTSSYLWRNVMPHLEGRGRLIAPDLIGMGDSDKLDFSGPNSYTFVEHSNFLYQLLEALQVKENVTLVIHDWGSALGFLWSFYNRFNPNAVKGIAFMEAIVAPFPSFDSVDEGVGAIFGPLRSPAGEQLVLQENFFIEQVLPSAIIRNLTDKEFAEYRRPYLNAGEDRRPTLTWPRQVPFDGEPADVTQLVGMYSEWLGTSDIPKLFIRADPGAILVGDFADLVRTWPAITEVTVQGIHFVQEDSFDEIGTAIADWLP